MRGLTNYLLRQFQRFRYHSHVVPMYRQPLALQQKWLHRLLKGGALTEWGKAHKFGKISNASEFAEAMPIQDYDTLRPYLQRIMRGESDVLWPGKTRWFAKSSGTTADRSKYIPVTDDNLQTCHKRGAWDTTTLIYHHRPDARQFKAKSMIMGGSFDRLEGYPGIQVGDVSAIMLHHLPAYMEPYLLPDKETALLADWEVKLDRLVRAGIAEPSVVMIGGVPTWTVVLFRRMLEMTGKSNMLEIWPDFQVYVHGGVSFTPYRRQFREFFPSDKVQFLEIYNATEGYFAAQDHPEAEGMLLLLDNGIYYEFLPMEEWGAPDPRAIGLQEVEVGKQYAIVISTNAGLWRYTPGDTVTFTSVNPFRIKVTGRTKQFINAFGEEVMVDNTDRALETTCRALDVLVSEYTVAPVYFSGEEKGGHQWLVEFEKPPADLARFVALLDRNLQEVNSDYQAKRFRGMALQELQLQPVPEGTFHDWLQSKGKAGGQHKVPRLANHRQYIEDILQFLGEKV